MVLQTSTIASHLPRAVGLALALGRARRLGVEPAFPCDSVVVCSLGDASVNHSTATGAVNAAIQTAYRGLPMSLLLVVEDNGIGISTPPPSGWVEHALGSRPRLRCAHVRGTSTWDALEAARELAAYVRRHRRPAFCTWTRCATSARRHRRRDGVPARRRRRGRPGPRPGARPRA